jgi:DNA-binding transcriptional regulator YiaG
MAKLDFSGVVVRSGIDGIPRTVEMPYALFHALNRVADMFPEPAGAPLPAGNGASKAKPAKGAKAAKPKTKPAANESDFKTRPRSPLAHLRKKRGWSVDEVAARFGASASTVAVYESQVELTEGTLARFAKVYRVKPEALAAEYAKPWEPIAA